MRLIFIIKHIEPGINQGIGSLALLYFNGTKICYLNRFIDKQQEKRFTRLKTGYMPVEIKRL